MALKTFVVLAIVTKLVSCIMTFEMDQVVTWGPNFSPTPVRAATVFRCAEMCRQQDGVAIVWSLEDTVRNVDANKY